MRAGTHVAVKELPQTLRDALRAVGYNRSSIAVEPSETFRAKQYPGEGQRAFLVVLNLVTGKSETMRGSWGGENPYTRGNAVDSDDTPRPIPPDGVIIQGVESSHPTYATVLVHPSSLAPLLPGKVDVTDRERTILGAYRSYTSGYRRQVLSDAGVVEKEIDALVQRGYLKRNTAGAVAITVAGKNALGEGTEHTMKAILEKMNKRSAAPVAEAAATPTMVDKITNAMINAPAVARLLERVAPSEEYAELYTVLPDILGQALVVAFNRFDIRATGVSRAERGLRQAARGNIEAGE